MPAAARYIPRGASRPPAPTSRTLAVFSFNCPSMPTSGMIRCRLYRRISSFDKETGEMSDTRAARDTRNNRQRVPVFYRTRIFVQIAYVFVVQIHIDETAQLTFVIKQVLLHLGVARCKGSKHFSHGRANEFNAVLF